MLIFLLTMSSRKLILFIVLPLTRAYRIFFQYLKFHRFIYIFMLMYCSQSKIFCQLIFCIVIFDIIWYFWSLKYCCLERDMRALHFSMVREFVVFFLERRQMPYNRTERQPVGASYYFFFYVDLCVRTKYEGKNTKIFYLFLTLKQMS